MISKANLPLTMQTEMIIKANLPSTMQIELEEVYCSDNKLVLNDDLRLKLSGKKSFGKLIAIYFNCTSGKTSLNIQRYYRPMEKLNKSNQFSKRELFLSDVYIQVEPSTFISKVSISTFEDFVSKQQQGIRNNYFCRAQWKEAENCLVPDLSQWKRDCLCNSIINPDVEYKFCPDCERILHVECLAKMGSSDCPLCGKTL